jgi:uncharacterized coiled-coil protein SlyX
MLTDSAKVLEERTLNLQINQTEQEMFREDISEYVAHLQLHMALQARNLVPTLIEASNTREQLLHETQANIEKLVSRQLA